MLHSFLKKGDKKRDGAAAVASWEAVSTPWLGAMIELSRSDPRGLLNLVGVSAKHCPAKPYSRNESRLSCVLGYDFASGFGRPVGQMSMGIPFRNVSVTRLRLSAT